MTFDERSELFLRGTSPPINLLNPKNDVKLQNNIIWKKQIFLKPFRDEFCPQESEDRHPFPLFWRVFFARLQSKHDFEKWFFIK